MKETYPLLALRGIIVFPNMVIPLEVGRENSINALEEAVAKDKKLVLAAQKDATILEPLQDDIYSIGTLSEVKQLLKLPEGQIRVLVEGLQRVEIDYFVDNSNFFEVAVTPQDSIVDNDLETEALQRSVLDMFEKYVKMSKRIPTEVIASVSSIADPDRFADAVAGQIQAKIEERQPLLEERSVKTRLQMLLDLLAKELDLLELEKKIQAKVRKQMERSQREYYLREQIKAIQVELGDRDERASEVEEYKEKLKSAKLPKEAKAKVIHELHRFEKMPPMAAEAVVLRNYLDWMLALPWSKTTKDRLDIHEAERILDQEHYEIGRAHV